MSNLEQLEISSTKKNTYLFFSHQNRIKMYVIDDFNNLLPSADKIDSKVRFSNGATLCLTIFKKTDGKFLLRLELLSTGDFYANKQPKKGKIYKYWITQEDQSNSAGLPTFFTSQVLTPKYVELDASSIQRIFKFDPNILNVNEPSYCFFVRHGYALHNDKKFRGDNYRKNTELTTAEFMNNPDRLRKLKLSQQKITEKSDGDDNDVEEDVNLENNKSGVQQAQEAGAKFSKIMDKKNITKIDIVAASDLLRTHQTAEYFLTKLNELKPESLKSINALYIIPCLHELMEKTRDGGKSLSGALGYLGAALYQENKTNCTDTDITLSGETAREKIYGRAQLPCTDITIGIVLLPIDWVFYKNFYGNAFRDGKPKSVARSCRDNHFLGLFFELLKSLNLGTWTLQGKIVQQPIVTLEGTIVPESTGKKGWFFGGKTHRKRKGRKCGKKTNKKRKGRKTHKKNRNSRKSRKTRR
jgi:hypothetical protein